MKLVCKKTKVPVDRLKIHGTPQNRWLCPACKTYHTIDELEEEKKKLLDNK